MGTSISMSHTQGLRAAFLISICKQMRPENYRYNAGVIAPHQSMKSTVEHWKVGAVGEGSPAEQGGEIKMLFLL